MTSILLLVVGLSAFLTGYRVYSRYIAVHVYRLDPDYVTPAHRYEDGIDYVPTNRHVLFGHHFTSVAGAAPIVGPAIAVIWGWLPAFLWVVLGTIFAGAVHDFGALWLSNRHRGRSIGALTGGVIGSRARTLFLLIIFLLLLMVNAVFAVIIANLFIANPGAILPVWLEVPTAIAIGVLVYRTRAGILVPSLVGLLLLYVYIWIGQFVQPQLPDFFGWAPSAAQLEAAGGDLAAAQAAAATDGVRAGWVIIMLVYALVASTLPVWLLLQPRDYINSHQLFVALGLIGVGVLVANPPVMAPAISDHLPADAPGWFPLLFITVACGAISGFHGLVASGTTSKQLDRETDARYIGYGGMMGEGSLALVSIIACTAGFAVYAGAEGWQAHYGSFAQAAAGGIHAFTSGVGVLAEGIGIPHRLAVIFAAVVVVSFAATTMDTGVRLQRYIIQELGLQYRIRVLQNGFFAAVLAVSAIGALALGVDRGAGGMRIWPLFGTTNQLTGALTLLVLTIVLMALKRNAWVTAVPMAFLFFMTTWAMVDQLSRHFQEQWLLFGVGATIFVLEIWLIVEAVAAIRRALTGRLPTSLGEEAPMGRTGARDGAAP
jgi:carbon starvation protein